MSFYTRFFDVNTEDFFGKLLLALNPFSHASVMASQADDESTELYGFIWINATLVFLMFVSATGSNLLAQWLHSGDDTKTYTYNFGLLTASVSIFYGYTVLIPTILYAVTTFVMHFQDRLSLTRLISIYSYANVLWIPPTAANIVLAVFISKLKHHVLLNALQWLLVMVSAVASGLSIVLKTRPIIVKNSLASGDADAGRRQQMILLAAIVLAHAGFAVVLKVLFFGIQ